ncbi:MAG: DUF433 domain-containing protein [Chloroflexi bacterium]|nr:DUF433 domain-containing protein [Chloroflexota bacterium]
MDERNLIERTNDILGGTPVFGGTRVPVQTLIDLGIILLVAPNNRLETLHPLMPNVLAALEKIQSGDIIRLEE